MERAPDVRAPGAAGADVQLRIEKVVLRLVKGGPERRAIEAGEADAILDPVTGNPFLLPAAQRWLLERERMRKQAEGHHPDRQERASLDGLAAQVGVLDAAGTVLSTNLAWRDDTRRCMGGGVAEGANYLAACDGADADDRVDGIALAAGIRQVIAGERKLFRYEHGCNLAATRCWFSFSITPAVGDGAARAVVSREDITERRRGELLLGLEYAVARGLAEATDAGAALKAVIRAVCEALEWDCGRYFRLDPAASVLRFHESWGMPTAAVQLFLEKSRDVTFRVDAGLKGRVYRSGQPLWVVANAADSAGVSPIALAPETDSDGAFIFPVMWANRTIGVLAFSGQAIREPDDRMLHAARAIGSQLGRYLQQQEALVDLRRSEARFRRLTELSTDWYWEQDREFRFTEYVGARAFGAAELLGKRLWEFPDVAPTAATWAEHRAQLGERWSFCDFEFTAVHTDGQPGYYSISGEPVFDERGDFVGYRGTGMDITLRKRAQIALQKSIDRHGGESAID